MADMRRSISAVSVSVALSLHACSSMADPRAGERKAQLCVLCHRVDSPHGAPTLEQQPADYLIGQIELFKSGKRAGPAMQTNVSTLSARDVRDIAEYFSLQPARRARTRIVAERGVLALGAAAAERLECAQCHGEGYAGAKRVPRLAGQLAPYLVWQMERFARSTGTHPRIAASRDEVEALARYLGSLEPPSAPKRSAR